MNLVTVRCEECGRLVGAVTDAGEWEPKREGPAGALSDLPEWFNVQCPGDHVGNRSAMVMSSAELADFLEQARATRPVRALLRRLALDELIPARGADGIHRTALRGPVLTRIP